MRILITILFLFSYQVQGFIPPITSMFREIFDDRKISDGTEFGFVHRVLTSSGDMSEVEERVLLDRRGVKFLWKSGTQGSWLSGQLEKRTYNVGTDKKIPSRSLLFLKYYIASNAAEFRDALINERFLKWDQLKQYKDGFELQGEPQTWDIKSNYLQQDSIFLALLPSGPSIAVVGYQDSNSRRIVYFDKVSSGLKQLQWVDPSENLVWIFESSTLNYKDALFPKVATLIKEGKEVVQSELAVIRQLNKRQLTEWGSLWQRSSKTLSNSPSGDENLRVLLGYR